MPRPITTLLLLPMLAGSLALLSGCFEGSAQNPDYQYTSSGTANVKLYVLTFFTANLANGQGSADGNIIISYNGISVQADGFPSVLNIPANAIVTVTAAPAAPSTTTVVWTGLTAGSNPLSRTFVMTANLTFGCTFTSSANG